METVTAAYNKNPGREWNRLERDAYHSLEFLVTMHFIQKYFPEKGVILDAGGGPGRYALELCRAGYQVILLDISPELIATARDRFASESDAVRSRLLDCIIGDIRNLSYFEAGCFDAVLCLGGPISHISNAVDRVTAVSELARVAKPHAPVYISVIGYLALQRTILSQFNDDLLEPLYRKLTEQGDAHVGGMLWHFFRADELRQLAESCGLASLEMAGCEGLSSGLPKATNALAEDQSKWRVWFELLLNTCTEPAIVDTAEHVLYIGRAPG